MKIQFFLKFLLLTKRFKMIVDISYQNTDDVENRVTVVRVRKSSKKNYLFDIAVLRSICSDLAMSFDRMGGEFYKDCFNNFVINAKEDAVIQIEISWEDTYLGIISSQSLPY